MKNDPEKIPVVVFHWIETLSFDALTVEQQSEVLNHMTADEYNELHTAALTVMSNPIWDSPASNSDSKAALMAAFGRTRTGRTMLMQLAKRPVPLWQAAVFFLVSLSAVVGLSFLLPRIDPKRQAAVQFHDTVYVTSQAEPLVVHDTVYPVGRMLSGEMVQNFSRRKQYQRAISAKVHPDMTLHVAGLQELEEGPNKKSGSSMKDDPLVKSFEVVRL
jgi:hypothetical protein